MATLRRNWPFFMILAVVCLLAVPLLIPHLLQQATVAQQVPPETPVVYEPLAPVDHDRLRDLRAELGLDQDALLALHLTGQQAEQLLAGLRHWYEQNKTELRAHDEAVGAQRQALRRIDQALRTGRAPASGTAHRQAGQTLASAQSGRQAFVEGAVTAVAAGLSQEQRTLLAVLRANRGEALPFRMIAMTDAQKRELKIARRHYQRQLAAAEDEAARQAAGAAWTARVESLLDSNQRERMTGLDQYAGAASERIVTALQQVFPEPETIVVQPQG